MCGIAAYFSRKRPLRKDALRRATATLHHRGPDSQQTWLSADQRVGLGHTRLSIIDLTGGEQPLANEDGMLRLIANGEFYEFERIRTDLEGEGHRFRTKSDSEIALHLYEDWGVHCVQKLRGEFAFVLWDEANHVLFAARDRFGIKPLYYAVHEDTIYLASEVKALFALGVPARWDSEYFYQHAAGPAMPDRTLFEGVYQLPPGHYLIATRNGLRLHRYWEFYYSSAAELAADRRPERAWVEEFREVFDDAVRLRMRADVPVGCYLSGGIDSCAVLGFAARHATKPIDAFTLTFDQDSYNEGPIAREMAAKAMANFHPIPIKQRDIAENFSEAVFHSETLFANGHGVSKFLLSRAVRDAGFKVVYTGEGSDEILGGYVHFRTDMLKHNPQGQDLAEVSRLLKELEEANTVSRGLLLPEGKPASLGSVANLLGFVPGCLQVWAGWGEKRLGMLADDFRALFQARDSSRLLLDSIDIPAVLTGRDPLNKSLFIWAKSFLPAYILNLLGDRMEMAHSIEGRLPFLDHHVVQLLGRVPISLKIRGITEKYLLRQAAQPVITDTVYRRQKHPFVSPPATTTPSEPFHALVQDTLRGAGLSSIPFFDQRKVVALLDALPGMTEGEAMTWDPHLTYILSACVLQDRFRLSAKF